MLANPHDWVSCQEILNVPSRNFGEKGQKAFQDYSHEKKWTLFEALQRIHKSKPPGLNKKQIERLSHLSKQLLKWTEELKETEVSPPEMIDRIIKETEWKMEEKEKECIDIVKEQPFEDEGNGLQKLISFLENITLVGEENEDGETNKVTLITIHQAKVWSTSCG